MTETKNYGFQKPDPADLVDVGVINQNFDKVDAELARKTIPIVLDQEIDLTQNINSIDVTEQVEALADRFAVDLKRGIPVSVSLVHQNKPFVFLLTDWFQNSEDYFVVWGISSNPHDVTKISRFVLNAFFGHNSDLQYHADIGVSGSGLPEDFPVSVDENGYTQIEGLPRANSTVFTKDGATIAVITTLEDGTEVNGTLALDDTTGYPVSYTEDGLSHTFAFVGFDEEDATTEETTEETTGEGTE